MAAPAKKKFVTHQGTGASLAAPRSSVLIGALPMRLILHAAQSFFDGEAV
jgi:hypothetical protein